MQQRTTRAFTLIELLVVIAIIGILSSVVLASLNAARKKGRDAKRIADVKQLQLALALYFDVNNLYPATTSVAALVTPGYIASIPSDPSNGKPYAYVPYAASAYPTICVGYHIGTSLETAGHTALGSAAQISSIPSGYVVCTAAGATVTSDFSASVNAQCQSGDAGVACFDAKQ